MPKVWPFFAVLLVGGILLGSTVVSAQDTGQWTTGAPMLSERSEVAVAEVGGLVGCNKGLYAFRVGAGWAGQRKGDRGDG